jgi:CubicO group peptidase (beta-lactamase class C family)
MSRYATLAFSLVVFAVAGMPARADGPEEGFTSIFNGKDLKDWQGNTEYWSVKDGMIVGKTTPANQLKYNTFLVWTGGKPADFELRFSYRIVGGNSGVQYRSQVIDDKKFVVKGYQADIDASPRFTGMNYEENGRGFLAQRGEKVTIGADGKKSAQAIGTKEDLQKKIKNEDWNDYIIIAKGNVLRHYVNGTLMSEVTDNEKDKAAFAGVIALQLHQGPAMTVEFKNFRIKEFKKQGGAAGKLERIEALLKEAVLRQQIAGGVAYVWAGRKWAEVAVGRRDVEANLQMLPNTLFRIASMTKPITSVAAMMLVEEGKLQLDDPVSKYIPEFADTRVLAKDGAAPMPAERAVTIHDLLTHTSGISCRFLAPPELMKLYVKAGVVDGLSEAAGTTGDNAKRLGGVPLLHQPGAAWSYGLSTDVLGRVIEVASGQTLDAFFRERIFGPLKMVDTFFVVPAEKRSRLAGLYTPVAGKSVRRVGKGPVRLGALEYSATYPVAEHTYYSGGSGLTSTAHDYARFLRMLLNGGELDGARLLKAETVAMMTANKIGSHKVPFTGHGDGFGYGFGVTTDRGVPDDPAAAGSYSWGGIFYTYFWVDPRHKLIGIMMTQLFPNDHLRLREEFKRLAYDEVQQSFGE